MKRRIIPTRSRFILALAFTLGLAGCAHYTPKPLVPDETAAHIELRTLSDSGLHQFVEHHAGTPVEAWPPKDWNLGLLTLAAFYYHPALEVARAQWNSSEAALTTARARPNPTLNFTPEFSSNSPTGVSPWLPSIGLDLPIETAGKRRYRRAQAQQLSESARWKILTTAWQVRHQLRISLLDFVAGVQREHLLNDQLKVRQEIIRLLEQRVSVGAIAGSDVIVARTLFAKVRLDLQTTRIDLADARVRVADALGVPVSALRDAELISDLDEPDSGGMSAQGLITAAARSRALRSRTDVLSALADYEATQSALQFQIAKQYPDIQLGPGYQWDQGENKWRIGISIELPLFNRNQGPIAEAEAHRAGSAARFIELQTKVISEVDHATSALQTAEQALLSGNELLSVQKQQLQSMQSQLAAGAVDALEVGSVQLELLGVQALAFEARVRAQQALGALEDAVQWPLGSEDEARTVLTQIESTQRPPQSQTKTP